MLHGLAYLCIELRVPSMEMKIVEIEIEQRGNTLSLLLKHTPLQPLRLKRIALHFNLFKFNGDFQYFLCTYMKSF